MKSSARFIIENARITRVNRRDKVSFITVYCNTGKFEQWIDMAAFDGVSDNVGEGESVTVKGDVQLAKKKDGERFRSIQLIVRSISPGQEDQTPALPEKKEKAAQKDETPVDDDSIPF